MVIINGIDVTYCIADEAYEVVESQTRPEWVRNSLTGRLYREETGIDGKIVRFHVMGLFLDSETYEALKAIYQSRELITFESQDTDGEVSAYMKDDEFRFTKKAEDFYEGTIVIEEVEAI